MSSLYLTATFPFEPRFGMFILNDYFAKAKHKTIFKLLGEKQKIDKILYLKYFTKYYKHAMKFFHFSCFIYT